LVRRCRESCGGAGGVPCDPGNGGGGQLGGAGREGGSFGDLSRGDPLAGDGETVGGGPGGDGLLPGEPCWGENCCGHAGGGCSPAPGDD